MEQTILCFHDGDPLIDRAAWQAPADLDPECLALCRALNQLPGITTVGSCCGHRREPFRIWFVGEQPEDVVGVALHLEFSDYCEWRVCVEWVDYWVPELGCEPRGVPRMTFYVEGPVGAFAEADAIAARIDG